MAGTTASSAPNTPPTPRRRRWNYLLAGAALAVVTVLIALPYVIRWQALQWLRQHGHPSAQIEDVDFNPFSGRLAVLSLGGDTIEGAALSSEQMAVQVGWTPLFRRRVVVEDVAMANVTIDVRREADGTLVVGRIRFPPPEETSVTPAEPGEPWLLGLGNLDLRNVTVRYADPLVDTTLLVQELHIDPVLQWEPDRDTAFHAELELDGEHWSLKGTVRPFAEAPSIDTQVQLQGLVQRRHPRLLAQVGVEELTLEANTDTHLQASYHPGSAEIEVRHQSTLQLRELQLVAGGARAEVGSLDWDGTVTVSGTTKTPRLGLDGTLSMTGYGANLAGQEEVGGESLHWQGPIEVQMEPDRLAVDVAGALDLAGIAAAVPSAGLHSASMASVRFEDLRLKLQRTAPSEEQELTVGGSVLLQQVAAEHDRGTATLDRLTLSLEPMRVHIPGGGAPLRATHAGTLQLSGLGAGLSSPPLGLDQPELQWQGELSFAQAAGDGASEIGVAGDLTAEQTRVSNRDNEASLLELDKLSLAGLAATLPHQAAIREIRLEGLRLLENTAPGAGGETKPEGGAHVLSLAEFRVEQLATQGQNHLEVGAIHLAGLQAWITRGEDGELAFQRALPQPAAPTTEPETPPGTIGADTAPSPAVEEPPFVVRLGEAHLEGTNRLVYLDSSVDPPFRFEVNPFEIHVGKIDSGDRSGMSPVTLRAGTGRYATIEVDGEVGLFATRPTLHLTGKAKGIELPPATAIAQRHTGYRIRSGMLDTDLRVDVDRGVLDSETELTANKLEMVKLDPENLDELDKQLGLPLGAALDLLRDSDDNIHLVIPVQGDLSDPDIDIGHAVRTALTAGMTKAISTGTLTYLAAIGSALVLPVGAAVAAGKAFSLATALRFAPVSFAPGESDLPAPVREQLDQMSTLLKERPKVRLTLCGYAAPADHRHLQEAELRRLRQASPPPKAAQPSTQPAPSPPVEAVELPEISERALLDLASSRSEAVKGYLVESRGIAPGRLLECSPEREEEEGAAPRVEVSL